jgi:hypothetical protein
VCRINRHKIVRVPATVQGDELTARLARTEFDPNWHAKRVQELDAHNNASGADLHRYLIAHEAGLRAARAGDWGLASAWFALKPNVPGFAMPEPTSEPPVGLLQEVYRGKNFDAMLAPRWDRELRWEGEPKVLVPDLSAELFTLRWTGYLKAPKAGKYRFAFHADDGLRVWIDGLLVIDAWRSPQIATHEVTVALTGTPQRVRIEYFQDRGGAGYRFQWVPPGATAPESIPVTALLPPNYFSIAPAPRPVKR